MFCKSCKSILFNNTDLISDDLLCYSKCSNVSFVDSMRAGLPVVSMRCKKCNTNIGIVKHSPLRYYPDKEKVTSQQNELLVKDLIQDLFKKPNPQENETNQQPQIDSETQNPSRLGKYVKGAFYWVMLSAPVVLSFFTESD